MMSNTEFDIGQLAGLLEWRQTGGDNSERLGRLRRCLPEAVADLTERQRQMVYLRYEEGLSGSDIARRLGLNRSTVSRCLRRAQKQLYDRLRFAL